MRTREWNDMEEVKTANAVAGRHWFEPSTMRFFRGRVGRTLYGGQYFVSSEQFDEHSPRLYTVRVARENGAIGTIGEFQGYPTRGAAIAAIHVLLGKGG